MAKKLVIVESPAKVKTINRILGGDFVVKSSVGHIRDLPLKSIGIDIKQGFLPKYVLAPGKARVVADLKKAVGTCDEVFLAPDPDREGEAIAWHLHEVLQRAGGDKPFHRVRFNEITSSAVREAIEHPSAIDQKLVGAQQARRLLDRLVGYTVSPLLWKRIARGLSAGRVQSVALRLICEREEEIRKFVPQEFWVLGALVRKQVPPQSPFKVKLMKIAGEKADITNQAAAEAAKADLDGRALRVAEIAIRQISKRAPPPFITSSLQQAGSSQCGFGPKRTMGIAQHLYEGVDLGEGSVGLITYMRTDSFAIAAEALESCRKFIVEQHGAEFCPEKPNFYKSRESAQEAHEAIRPTDVRRTPESLRTFLDASELKLYSLIWRRFVASQMTAAQIDQRTVRIEALPDEKRSTTYLFQVGDSNIVFPGYMKVAGMELKDEASEDDKAGRVPALVEGEPLDCLEWLMERKETQPPPRFSETALVGVLESNGVGRPSTYAQIISTLEDRKYVQIEKRTLFPTDMGMRVSELLVGNLPELFDVKFTALMEEKLDAIAEGSVEWTAMLKEFYAQFQEWMARIAVPEADQARVQSILGALVHVQTWAPEEKRGKRTFSDGKFVESVRKQYEGKDRKVSERQRQALVRIAARYKDQDPRIAAIVSEENEKAGGEPGAVVAPPTEQTLRKLALLKNAELPESAGKFILSLQQRVDRGQGLTDAQSRVLDRIVVARLSQTADFETVKAELGIDATASRDDEESRALVQAMSPVTVWKPAVTRGTRTFDDEAFYRSLSQQLAQKGFLSFRQRISLRRLLGRYRDQIPNYEELAGKFGQAGKGASKEGNAEGAAT